MATADLPPVVPQIVASPIESVARPLDAYLGQPLASVTGRSAPAMFLNEAAVGVVAGGALGAVARSVAGEADARGCVFNVGQVDPLVSMTGLPPQVVLSASVGGAVAAAAALLGLRGATSWGLVAGAVSAASPFY